MNEHKTAKFLQLTREREALSLLSLKGSTNRSDVPLRLELNRPKHEHYIAVVTAGTNDIPVAEEAAGTAELFGNRVKRIYDVGVAGIHRLFNRLEHQGASVVIVIAVWKRCRLSQCRWRF